MTTLREEAKTKVSQSVRKVLLETSKNIHAKSAQYRDVLSVRDFLSVPYAELMDLHISRLNIDLNDNTGLVDNLEGINRSAMEGNLARIFARELDIYREIVDTMDNEIESLENHVKNIPIDYNLPELVTNTIPNFITVYISMFSEDLEIRHTGMKDIGSLVELGLRPDNIKEELKSNLSFAVTDGNSLLKIVSDTYIVKTLDGIFKNETAGFRTFKEAGVLAMFMEWLKENHPTARIIERIRVILLNSRNALGKAVDTDNVIEFYDANTDTAYLHAKNYKKYVTVNDSTAILGAILTAPRAWSYNDLTTDFQALISKYNLHMNTVEAKTRLNTNIRIKEYFRNYKDRVETILGKSALMRSNRFVSDVNLLIRISNAINNLKSDEIKDITKVIETVYLEVLFKGSKFETFYKSGQEFTSESATQKASVGLYNLIVITLLRGTTHG